MSDETSSAKKSKVVHYGSLEARGASALSGGDAAPQLSKDDYFALEEPALNREKAQVLEEFERKKKARLIKVSTDDSEVRAQLREISEPICLFGEGPAERRERLRQILSKLGQDVFRKRADDEAESKSKEPSQTWYHEGSESLRQARFWIANFSMPRAKERLETARQEKMVPESIKTATKNDLYKRLRSMEISASQVGDQRPISSCRFSPNSELIATASWTGLCKLWSRESLSLVHTFKGHNGDAGSIVFHPKSTISQDAKSVNLASCGHDGSVYLWNMISDEPIYSLSGHSPYRVAHTEFHPSGRFLATCCFDKSWRLWDLGAGGAPEEILFQEGHSKAVFDVAFHPDGSLAATGGLDGYGRVWDLRSGRCIHFMEGHQNGITSIAFSPNGYHVATGSLDHTVRIWNLRERKCEYTIPAHTHNVSRVLFEPEHGRYLASCSFDQKLSFWCHPGWTPIQTLQGHDQKVMCADVSLNSSNFITASYDRTFKIWEPDMYKD